MGAAWLYASGGALTLRRPAASSGVRLNAKHGVGGLGFPAEYTEPPARRLGFWSPARSVAGLARSSLQHTRSQVDFDMTGCRQRCRVRSSLAAALASATLSAWR